MMKQNQRDIEMWERYVRGQSAQEFMELSQDMTVEEAVQGHISQLDEMFGKGTRRKAPADLAECLVRYIDRDQAGD